MRSAVSRNEISLFDPPILVGNRVVLLLVVMSAPACLMDSSSVRPPLRKAKGRRVAERGQSQFLVAVVRPVRGPQSDPAARGFQPTQLQGWVSHVPAWTHAGTRRRLQRAT
jgi:hypothetical protein